MSQSKRTRSKISRREFVKGAALGAGTLAGAGALASCSPSAATPVGVPEKWDREVDVVVLGTGTVLVGALSAYDAGAGEVLILEKMPTGGGSTIMSGGMFWVPNNPIQKASGHEDSREEAITYLTRVAEGTADLALIEAFVDEGAKMVDFLQEGTPLDLMTDPFPDYHPDWEGAKNTRSLDCKPGFVQAYAQGEMVAALLIAGLLEACEDRGIEVMYETPAKRLVARMLDDGRMEVLGVLAEVDGEEAYIKARKAVLMGAGGFPYNEEMCKHFLRGPFKYPFCNPGNTGDGILMGMAVGAGLRNMNQAWGMPCYNMGDEKVGMFAQDRAKPGCILVNKHGERFLNESANYETIQRAFYRWDVVGSTGSYRNIPGFAIVDANHLNKYGFVGGAPGEESPLLAKADTLRELASKLGVDPDGLEKTVEEFNGYAKDGHDPVFHRGETEYDKFWSGFYDPESPVLVPVETPPFYGSPEVWPGGIGTKGGLAVNEHGQCLTPFNEVVPRLYASGNNSGVGAPGADYGGAGGTMGPGMVFAYIGGNHAAEEEPWG